jgi:hypothetical protein
MINNNLSNNEDIEYLKNLFYKHFQIKKYNSSNSQIYIEELKDCRLNLNSFKEIMSNWIDYLDSNKNSANKNESNMPSNNKLYYCKKKQYLKYSSTSYTKLNNNETNNQCNEEESSLIGYSSQSSSSIPSLSLSDDDTLFTNRLIFNDPNCSSNGNINSTNSKHIELERSNESINLQKINELTSENKQYRQTIMDLKTQLQNAEEMNTQLVTETESQTNRINNLNKLIDDLYLKLNSSQEDNENLRRMYDQSRMLIDDMNNENNRLSNQYKDSNSKKNELESYSLLLNNKLDQSQNEINKLLCELNEKKVYSKSFYLINRLFFNNLKTFF